MNHAFRLDDKDGLGDRTIHPTAPRSASGNRDVYTDRPSAIDMSRMATKYVDGMSPLPSDEDRPMAQLAWMAFVIAQSAHTKIGRIAALRELATAISLIKDVGFRGRLVDAQCVELEVELFSDYEETVLSSPPIAHRCADGQSVATNNFDGQEEKSSSTSAQESLSRSFKPKARFRIGTMVAASVAICCTFVALRELRRATQVTADHVTSKARDDQQNPPHIDPKKQNDEGHKLFDQTRLPSTMIVDVDPLEDRSGTISAATNQEPAPVIAPPAPAPELEFTWFTEDALPRKGGSGADNVTIRLINSSLRTSPNDAPPPVSPEQEAVAELREAEASFGPESQKLTRYLSALANIYFQRRDYSKAEPLYQRKLKILQSIQSTTPEETMHCSDEVAQCLLGTHKLDDAIEMFEKMLAYYEGQFGADDHRTIDCVNHLAQAHLENRDFAAAIPLFERVLRNDESTHQGSTEEVADHLDHLALAKLELKDYHVAKKLFERAYTMRRSLTWAGNPILAISENHLGVLYAAQRDYQNAKLHFTRCEVIICEALGEQHVLTALVYDNLAKVHLALGETKRAVSFWKSAVRIRREKCGPIHPDTLATMRNIRKWDENSEQKDLID
eukprot:TRINITY_DN1379_c0_g2_i2.p1 TRINITY_DN1379_c0_g2~~TRINITY_DN1379_c0_g2_i2.p1  ORF type:complete len:617 (-),score=84.90 TRINITY_DN1379_c0_g2_i2:4182-6032(-)